MKRVVKISLPIIVALILYFLSTHFSLKMFQVSGYIENVGMKLNTGSLCSQVSNHAFHMKNGSWQCEIHQQQTWLNI